MLVFIHDTSACYCISIANVHVAAESCSWGKLVAVEGFHSTVDIMTTLQIKVLQGMWQHYNSISFLGEGGKKIFQGTKI